VIVDGGSTELGPETETETSADAGDVDAGRSETDAGATLDGSVPSDRDAGINDAGTDDGGQGVTDGGESDGGTGIPDGGKADAGEVDPGALLRHQWSKRFGSKPDRQLTHAVGTDADLNVILAGEFGGTVDFGKGPLSSLGGSDVFVAKFDAKGTSLWSKGFGDGTRTQSAEALVVDSANNVIVVGTFDGSINFGGETLVAVNGGDLFMVKFAPDGTHVWSKRFGDAALTQYARAVAVDGSNNIVLVGDFDGTLDFGGGPMTTAGASDLFVARFDAAGTHLWSKQFGDDSLQQGKSVATDKDGNVLVFGNLTGTIDLGGGPLKSAGGGDIFLAKLDSTGAHLWSKRFGDELRRQYATSVATDPSGNVYFGGQYEGSADFGGGVMSTTGLNDSDVYVVKYSPAGDHLWSKKFGDDWLQTLMSMAVDSRGNVTFAGRYKGSFDFGGGPFVETSAYLMYFAKLDTNGGYVWNSSFGQSGKGDYNPNAMTTDKENNVIISGHFWGPAFFGGEHLTSATADVEVFSVKYAP
jgi:hypothetical protein